MALTPSNMVPLGATAPDFSLPEPRTGKMISKSDFDGKPLLVMFICNHCPYVKAVNGRLVRLAQDYEDASLGIVAICSNDPERYPADNFEAMKERAEELGYPFPYLQDESQEVAEAYGAECTPDFFLYDRHRNLFYRGRLDDNWKDAAAVTRHELRMAIDAALEGAEPPASQEPSMGCSIKWKH